MSKFFVGQRVRIVRPWGFMGAMDWINWMGIRGSEGRVSEVSCLNQNFQRGVAVIAKNDEWVLPEYGLEPIIPDGQRASDYSLSELLDRCRQGEGVQA